MSLQLLVRGSCRYATLSGGCRGYEATRGAQECCAGTRLSPAGTDSGTGPGAPATLASFHLCVCVCERERERVECVRERA